MLIRLGYDIEFEVPSPVAMVALLSVHPSRAGDLKKPDQIELAPQTNVEEYLDSFGNRCSRFLAPAGTVRLSNSTVIADSGEPDLTNPDARQVPVEHLPPETLRYLMNSRYCEIDRLSNVAAELFNDTPLGWARVEAICNWVHQRVIFGYHFARSTKTALDVYTERTGVCRDFQHLAITFCRCMHIPARYATGYLGDIGVPPQDAPMDFSAWFEAYLEDRWWTFDARHNRPRIGRVMIATGRDASDVAITTSFGASVLKKFNVVTAEMS